MGLTLMFRDFIFALAVLCVGAMSAVAETPIERGGYLVNAVMACDACHTPRGPGGIDMERRFSFTRRVLEKYNG